MSDSPPPPSPPAHGALGFQMSCQPVKKPDRRKKEKIQKVKKKTCTDSCYNVLFLQSGPFTVHFLAASYVHYASTEIKIKAK